MVLGDTAGTMGTAGGEREGVVFHFGINYKLSGFLH